MKRTGTQSENAEIYFSGFFDHFICLTSKYGALVLLVNYNVWFCMIPQIAVTDV